MLDLKPGFYEIRLHSGAELLGEKATGTMFMRCSDGRRIYFRDDIAEMHGPLLIEEAHTDIPPSLPSEDGIYWVRVSGGIPAACFFSAVTGRATFSDGCSLVPNANGKVAFLGRHISHLVGNQHARPEVAA